MISDGDELTDSSAQTAFRDLFGRIGAENARRVINVLLEAPFFYRDDDLDTFGLLRRRISLFREFFEVFFGWDLYVDDYVARLIKPKTFNPELKPRQRHVFRATGRHEYVLFTLLLEFHQRQADEQNLDLDRCDEVRFVLADFIEFVFKRYREELGEDTPPEEKILGWARSLFEKLERYRFIAVREKTGLVAEEGLKTGFTREGTSCVLYALLPGLRCYRAEALTREDMLVGSPAVEPRSDPGAEEPNGEDDVEETSPEDMNDADEPSDQNRTEEVEA